MDLILLRAWGRQQPGTAISVSYAVARALVAEGIARPTCARGRAGRPVEAAVAVPETEPPDRAAPAPARRKSAAQHKPRSRRTKPKGKADGA